MGFHEQKLYKQIMHTFCFTVNILQVSILLLSCESFGTAFSLSSSPLKHQNSSLDEYLHEQSFPTSQMHIFNKRYALPHFVGRTTNIDKKRENKFFMEKDVKPNIFLQSKIKQIPDENKAGKQNNPLSSSAMLNKQKQSRLTFSGLEGVKKNQTQNFLVNAVRDDKFTNFFLIEQKVRAQKSRRLQTFTPIEFIKNGDFSITSCTRIYCIWNTTNFRFSNLPHWQPLPQIQVCIAKAYSIGKEQNYIIQLAAQKPSCVRQLMQNLPSGIYQLNYVYSLQKTTKLSMSQIYVFLNDTQIDSRMSPNYSWHTAVKNVTISTANSSYYLKFCGNKDLNRFGALIFSVSFLKISQTPATPIIPNNTVTTTTTNTGNTTTTDNTSLIISPGNTTTNTTNQTYSTDESSQSNITNPINQSTQQNHNNQTILYQNETMQFNQTEITHLQNFTYMFNMTFNSTDNPDAYFYSIMHTMTQQQFIQYFISIATNMMENPIISQFFKSPLIRKVFVKGYAFMPSIDHLWLYVYQPKYLETKYDSMLRWINDMQRTKWSLIPSFVQYDLNNVKIYLDQKQVYTPFSFLMIEGQSREFLLINYEYFLANIPVVILVFVICKLISYFFCKFGYPSVLKDFRLNSFIIILLLEGNSQHFTYFLLSDILTMFANSPKMKLINLISVGLFFILLFLLIAIPFILRSIYQKSKNVQFYEKSKNCLKGTVFFMIDFGLFNILLGSIHILCESDTKLQFILLMCVQLVYVLYVACNFNPRRQVLTSKVIIWINLWASMVRVILIVSEIHYDYQEAEVSRLFDKIQEDCIFAYIFLLVLSLVHLFMGLFSNMVQTIYKKFFGRQKIELRQKRNNQNLKNVTRQIRKKNKTKIKTSLAYYDAKTMDTSHKRVKKVVLIKRAFNVQLNMMKKSSRFKDYSEAKQKNIIFRPIFEVIVNGEPVKDDVSKEVSKKGTKISRFRAG